MLPAPSVGPRHRAFRSGDIRETFLYFLSAIVVGSLPERSWPAIANGFSRFSTRKTSRYERFRSAVEAVLGDEIDGATIPDLYARAILHGHRRRLYVAATRRRRGWTPAIELLGREHLDEAHARGRGVILWFDNFIHFPIIGKRAVADAGYRLWHLGSHLHGFSTTDYSVRFLNPRQIQVEGRYLAGRIMFDNRTVVAATRRVVEILADNDIISITNNANLGKSERFPFGKAAKLAIATTPFRLAASHGVPLLPVSVIEVEPLARYRVTIAEEIVAPDGRSEREAIPLMAADYIDYLLPIIRAYPDQWGGWRAISGDLEFARERQARESAPMNPD